MILSKLEKYIIDTVCDDYFGLWEVISFDNYLIESDIGYDPSKIKKSVKKLIVNNFIKIVRGNMQTNKVKSISKKNA